MGGPSIIDYYSGRGFNFGNIEGELSQIEEQEILEKKAKQRARKKARAKSKKKEGEEASDDVEIEIDKDEPPKDQNLSTNPQPSNSNTESQPSDLHTALEAQLKSLGVNDGMEILSQLNDVSLSCCFLNSTPFQLRNQLADQPHEARVKNAELITSAVMKMLEYDDE